jgi:hypothetical protein
VIKFGINNYPLLVGFVTQECAVYLFSSYYYFSKHMSELSMSISEKEMRIADVAKTIGAEVDPKIEEVRLVEEIKRLRFDTHSHDIPVINMNAITGEDLRDKPLERAQALYRKMVVQAEHDLRSALGIREIARFSGRTSREIPKLETDESGVPTTDSLSARVEVFRQEAGDLVREVEEGGVQLPGYDDRTGEKIPKDSLSMLKAAEYALEMRDLKEDLEKGFEVLDQLKSKRSGI